MGDVLIPTDATAFAELRSAGYTVHIPESANGSILITAPHTTACP
jgi:hypothetical protein